MGITGTTPSAIDADIEVTSLQTETVVFKRTAGEAISKYDTVYFDGAKIKIADASSINTMPVYGMANEDIANGEEGYIWVIVGSITNAAWAFAPGEIGKTIFADAVAGGIATTPPAASGNISQRLGRVLATTKITFDPDETYYSIA